MLAQVEESDMSSIPEIEDSDEVFNDAEDAEEGSEEDEELEKVQAEENKPKKLMTDFFKKKEPVEEDTEALIGGTSSMATMDINFNNLSATSYF